jgi:hypothetical protein
VSIRYQSMALLRGRAAQQVLEIVRAEGAAAALAAVKSRIPAGEGTLISAGTTPWDAKDTVFEQDPYLLFYNGWYGDSLPISTARPITPGLDVHGVSRPPRERACG